jgi:hypothetical protein
MAKYRYEGPQPDVDDAGELVHPGDVRVFDSEPDCPPWVPLEDEAPAPPPPDPPKAPATTPATGTEGGM